MVYESYTFLGIISVGSIVHIQTNNEKSYFHIFWLYIQIQNVLIYCNIFRVCIIHKNIMVILLNMKSMNYKGLVTTALFMIGKSIEILQRQNHTVSSICSHLGHIGFSSYGVTKYVFTTKSWFWNWRKNDTKTRIYRGMQSQLRCISTSKQHKQDICRGGCGWSKVIRFKVITSFKASR